MSAAIPHRSVLAAMLAISGAVCLLGMPLALRAEAAPWLLAAVIGAGGATGGLVTGAMVRLPAAPAAVAAAVAVALLHALQPAVLPGQMAVLAAIGAATTAAGARIGGVLSGRWHPRRALAALIIVGVMVVVAGTAHRFDATFARSEALNFAMFGSFFVGGMLDAALVADLRRRDVAGGAALAMLGLISIVVLAQVDPRVWLGGMILVPIAAGRSTVGFWLARDGLGLGARRARADLPAARALGREP